jgi:hypothetical protein
MTTKSIMASANHEECTVRLPEVCNFDPSTVVFAHVNGVRFGKGIGIKTKFGAYACSECHRVIDGGDRPSWMSKKDILVAHYEAVLETMAKLVDKGLMVFK